MVYSQSREGESAQQRVTAKMYEYDKRLRRRLHTILVQFIQSISNKETQEGIMD